MSEDVAVCEECGAESDLEECPKCHCLFCEDWCLGVHAC